MNRRLFLGLLAAVPFAGHLTHKPELRKFYRVNPVTRCFELIRMKNMRPGDIISCKDVMNGQYIIVNRYPELTDGRWEIVAESLPCPT